MSDTRTVRIADIKIGKRHRKELGDLEGLAASIAKKLLHPPVLDSDMTLVCGFRRVRAAELNGWETIPVRVLDIEDLIEMEHDENELRKDFTVSERVAIGEAIEAKIGERRGNPSIRPNSDELETGRRTDEHAANSAGFGGKSAYREAKAVVADAIPELVKMVDRGKVSVNAAAIVAKLPKAEQEKIVADGPGAVKEAASKKRKGKEKKPKVDTPDDKPKDEPEPTPDLVKQMESTCRELDQIKHRIESWKELPLAHAIHFPTIVGGIERLRSDLWGCRPAFPCPYCEAKGAKADCKACKGTQKVVKHIKESGMSAMNRYGGVA